MKSILDEDFIREFWERQRLISVVIRREAEGVQIETEMKWEQFKDFIGSIGEEVPERFNPHAGKTATTAANMEERKKGATP